MVVELGEVVVVPVAPVEPGDVLVPVVPGVVEVAGDVVLVPCEFLIVLLPVVVPEAPEVAAGTIPEGHGLLTVALALRLPGELEFVVELAEVPLPTEEEVEDVAGPAAVDDVPGPACDEEVPPTWLLPVPT